jgi:hypothetical protein
MSLISLAEKGILWYANRVQDRVFAPWMHKSRNAEEIKDFGILKILADQ